MLMTKLNRLCAFLVLSLVFDCDITVLNGKHVNNHVMDYIHMM